MDAKSFRCFSGLSSTFVPRVALFGLAGAHLALAFLQSWPLPQQLDRWFGPSPYGVWEVLVSASGGVAFAQLALVAAYMTFGGGRVLARIVRGALLLLWLELAQMAGTYWLDSGRDSRGFEESIGITLWNFAFLILPLLLYQLYSWRRLLLPGMPPKKPKVQFRILHLLLVMTEAAALLAAIRAFVAKNDQWRDELWRSIRDYPFEFASYDLIALSLLAAIPAVFMTLRLRSPLRAGVVLLLWEMSLSIGFVVYRYLLPELDPQFPLAESDRGGRLLVLSWLQIAAFCLTAGSLVWISLTVVRSLGYDFLPVRGDGRQSTVATSEA